MILAKNQDKVSIFYSSHVSSVAWVSPGHDVDNDVYLSFSVVVSSSRL